MRYADLDSLRERYQYRFCVQRLADPPAAITTGAVARLGPMPPHQRPVNAIEVLHAGSLGSYRSP